MLAAVLLILAFPDFEYWFLAWFALTPLMFAVELEKASVWRSFLTGWIFGTVFFYGTCWWLTYAPIHYAGFPPWLAYSGMLFVAAIAGLFPAIFAGILAVLLRRFGSWGYLAAPFVWVFTEFLRYWLTGNNWNAIGYSQAFAITYYDAFVRFGGIWTVGLHVLAVNGAILFSERTWRGGWAFQRFVFILPGIMLLPPLWTSSAAIWNRPDPLAPRPEAVATVIAIQPNVPMSGLDYTKWGQLRQHQIDMAEAEIKKVPAEDRQLPITVILPESPMNFMYNDDREFQKFVNDFARRNNVSVLFNSAEPDPTNGKYFNSAVMVGPDGREVAEYDKIYLLPFGEAVPAPLEGILPGFVGNFSYGREYDLLPVGEAKAGVMICFESHFGALSRRYVQDGADVLIEMTNDGYLGPTPVLRQHLANAVFRAVETNRPVLRVTNVGVTAYINERGQVLDPLPSYTEGTRVWSVPKSDRSQTFYLKYGDWFAWLSTIITVLLLMWCLKRQPIKSVPGTE